MPSVRTHTCMHCADEPAFATAKALASHMRAKHGKRNEIRKYVDSAVCPVCKTDFKERLRCIAHLSDSRRARCRNELLHSGMHKPIPEWKINELDACDAALR
eukprot:3230690-Karenia_brevis.AAC.1